MQQAGGWVGKERSFFTVCGLVFAGDAAHGLRDPHFERLYYCSLVVFIVVSFLMYKKDILK